MGILVVSQDSVVTSALKPGSDWTAVLRVYEAAGKPSQGVRVTFHTAIGQARNANLIEDAGTELRMDRDSIVFDLRPFEIKTFRFTLRQPLAGVQKASR
jgi:alpha-mannosidase